MKKWVNTALEEMAGIQQEIEILQHMARMKSKQEEGVNAEPAPPKEKPRQVREDRVFSVAFQRFGPWLAHVESCLHCTLLHTRESRI